MLGIATYSVVLLVLLIRAMYAPAAALGGVLCMFGLEQWGQNSSSVLLRYHLLTNLCIGGIVIIACVVRMARGGKVFRNISRAHVFVLGLFAYAYSSVVWAPNFQISYAHLAGSLPYVITLLVLTPMLFVYESDFREGLLSFMIVGAVIGVLILTYGKWDYRWLELGDRDRGNPLAIAQMASGTALVALLCNFKGSKLWVVLRWVVVIVGIVVVVRTSSRGQLLAFFASAIACWPLSRRVSSIMAFLGWAVAIGVMGIAGAWSVDQFMADDKRWSVEQFTNDVEGRLHAAVTVLMHWWNSDMGVVIGLGNSASFSPQILGIYPHIMPLEILAEEGIIGFAIFIALLIHLARATRKAYGLVRADPLRRGVLATIASLTLMGLLLSCKQGSMLLATEFFLYSIMLGQLCGIISKNAQGAAEAKEVGRRMFERNEPDRLLLMSSQDAERRSCLRAELKQ